MTTELQSVEPQRLGKELGTGWEQIDLPRK